MTDAPLLGPLPGEPGEHQPVHPAELSRTARQGRRRTLRWLVPVGATGAIALVASGVLSASANPNLPQQSAAQLLASVRNAKVAGFSGTVVEKASLGLPQLPQLGGSSPSAGLLGMLSGSHTARVWYAGETKQRVALLDALGEQDLFRNGRDVWQWNSDNRTATHSLLPADAAHTSPEPSQLPTLTPDQAAQQALSLIDPSTTVNTDRTGTVAGRSTYTLVLTPKDTRSRVGSVRISVDGTTRVPLGVQVYPKNSDHAAIDIAFTRVKFAVPDDDNFTFRPPSGVKPKETTLGASSDSGAAPGSSKVPGPKDTVPGAKDTQSNGSSTTIGSGWTTIFKMTGVPSASALGKQGGEANAMLNSLQAVSGDWGRGRLLTSTLLTALITDDGRVYVGAVDPGMLYAAAHK